MADNKESSEEKQSVVGWLVETALLVAAAFLLAMGIRAFLIDTRVIPTGSMEPTIAVQNRLLVDRIGYRFRPIERGDIIVFRNWRAGEPDLIKRVVGLPGETVAMDDEGRFTVDGKPLDEPFVAPENRRTIPGPRLPVEVPEDSVFVMGDNRNHSDDSRFNGPVKKSDVLGRAFFTYWPPSQFGVLR